MNSTKENDLKKNKNLKEKDVELSEEELQRVTGGDGVNDHVDGNDHMMEDRVKSKQVHIKESEMRSARSVTGTEKIYRTISSD